MEEIKILLDITKNLKEKYGRDFTLDGKLVGDIGEVLASQKYGLELLPSHSPIHDAREKTTGRLIQIKSSFKYNSYITKHEGKIPEYFLSINIDENGCIEEIFNGPEKFIFENYVRTKPLKADNSGYNLAKGVLQKLNLEVKSEDKIKVVTTC